MRLIRYTDPGYQKIIRSLERYADATTEVQETVREIIQAVRKEGDKALCHFTEKFHGPKLTPAKLRVPEEVMEATVRAVDPSTKRALLAARKNVEQFARKSLRTPWSMRNTQGVLVGERFDPFQRVGIYIPGGTAPLVSTAVMTCTLARVAKVPEIVAVTPAAKDGAVHPALLAALSLCGATEVYKVGGAQAVAALAYGTKTIAPVAKIFGPGNAYVVEAKRQVFGRVGVDLLPGPSEVLVIADDAANPEWIAADLLAQSEHGHGSISVLLTPSERLWKTVSEAVQQQAQQSERHTFLKEALKNALLIQVASMDEAVELANAFASEHVSIATRKPDAIAKRLTTSGALFLGGISPVVGGDFLAGPSHELPTGGAGKAFAGLTVDQFQRRTSLVQFDRASLEKSLPYLETFSAIEGLDAHGRSAAIRVQA